MLRSLLPVMILAWGASLAGCENKSAPASRSDNDVRNIAVAGATGVASTATLGEVAVPLESASALDPWMKLPPMELKARVERVLHCGRAMTSPRKCNLYRREGALAQSPTEEQGQQYYAVKVWVTVPAEIYHQPPTEQLPRAPFRVVHYLLPHWREADAWLTFALRNARRACGMQARVGNALVDVDADFGIENTYIVTLKLSPYRPSVERNHAECVAGESESDTDRHAEVIAMGKPWNEKLR